MRKGLFVVAIVLLILGIATAGFITYLTQVPVTTNIQPGHVGDLTVSTLNLGPQSSTIKWSNALATDTIYVTTSNPTTCTHPANQVAKGTGASGSFAVTLTPGSAYYVFGCTTTGTLASMSVSYTTIGLNIITIGGVVFAIIGVVLLVVSLRKPKPVPGMMGGMSSTTMPPSGPGGAPPPQ